MKISSGVFLGAIGVLSGWNTTAHADYTYTELKDPLAVQSMGGTQAYGISGNTVVGVYHDSLFQQHGFSETGGVYTTITGPAGAAAAPYGISGDTIVGSYFANGAEHGFTKNGGVYTTLDDPSAGTGTDGTFARGVTGNTVVGYYIDSANVTHGFSETGGVFTTLDDPLAKIAPMDGTFIYGISGDTVVGQYSNSAGGNQGFTETDGVFTDADIFSFAISGGTIAGWTVASASGPPGFTEPGALETDGVITETSDPSYNFTNWIYGIDGTTIVGQFDTAANDGRHSFIAFNVPEPASLAFLVCGTLTLLLRRRRLA